MNIDRLSQLKQRISEGILVVDGAMGTFIQSLDLTATDFGGAEYEGCKVEAVIAFG